MTQQCTTAFDAIAQPLGGFTCENAPAIIHFRSPLELSNWTLPVVEVMMVLGAVLALIHSIRRLRRDGEPINLALWFATVVYLLVIEIPLYFPNIFGVEEQVGTVFVHNAFTVQFLFERLPLYIVALYPAVVTLAFEIVRSLGVFRDRGIVVSAICVGFVHHCLYEVFDNLGPQLRWWSWNPTNSLNYPMLESVPMTSVFIFAALGPVVVTVLVLLLVGDKPGRTTPTGWSLTWRTALAGVLVPIGLVILCIPTTLFGGSEPNTTMQAIIFAAELAVIAVIALPALARQWQRMRQMQESFLPNRFVRIFGPMYLGVLGVLWIAALPEYFSATDGITADGTPTGSLVYATVCFVIAALAVYSVSTTGGASALRRSADAVKRNGPGPSLIEGRS